MSFVQWGYLQRDLDRARQPDTSACRALRGLGACWAVIPEKYRFILFGTYPFDEQWRPALRTLVFIALFVVSSRRRFWRKELVLVWVGRADADRRADVGRRRSGLPYRVAGPLGRAAGDADPRDLRARLRLSARHPRRARPPLETAGDQLALRALCRADPRRAADQPAVHGQRDVSAVPARRRQHRQTAARADRLHPVRRRLSGRSRARRPAGRAAGTVRGGRRARACPTGRRTA